MSVDAPFNCPKCGAHDYGLYAAGLLPCPHCQARDLAAARQEIAALKADAERWRYCKSLGVTEQFDGWSIVLWVAGAPSIETLDAAIDAASNEIVRLRDRARNRRLHAREGRQQLASVYEYRGGPLHL